MLFRRQIVEPPGMFGVVRRSMPDLVICTMHCAPFPFRFARDGLIALVLAGLLCGAAAAAERVQVTIAATTDLHGYITPTDYFANRPAEWGLAKAATLIRDIRRTQPDAVLLDVGDTIQGSPLAYVNARRHTEPANPMMVVMNALAYDAMTVGNHEYNFGPTVREKAHREAAFPWLSANTVKVGTDEPAYVPFIMKEIKGVRVAVLGLTTPGIPAWENADNFAGLAFLDPVETAQRWVARLRSQEHADVVVVSMHMGLEENLATGRRDQGVVPNENTALQIAREVPGVDVILMGHTHREISALEVNGVLLTQPYRWGACLSRVDVYLDRETADGAWHVVAKSARTIPVTEKVAPDVEVTELATPYEAETQAWLGKAIGTCDKNLSAADARLRDTAILDLVQRAQLDAGHADVSMAAAFNTSARVPAGAVTVRDIAGLYVYENTLVVVEVTGAQLAAALEHAARYFLPYEAGKSAADLMDPNVPGYNFDMAEGVTYAIDLSCPPGARIKDLAFDGRPLDPARKLRLAINNYRHNGGGGYVMFKDAPVLERSSAEIRNLIIDWVERNGAVPSEPTDNWRLVVPGE